MKNEIISALAEKIYRNEMTHDDISALLDLSIIESAAEKNTRYSAMIKSFILELAGQLPLTTLEELAKKLIAETGTIESPYSFLQKTSLVKILLAYLAAKNSTALSECLEQLVGKITKTDINTKEVIKKRLIIQARGFFPSFFMEKEKTFERCDINRENLSGKEIYNTIYALAAARDFATLDQFLCFHQISVNFKYKLDSAVQKLIRELEPKENMHQVITVLHNSFFADPGDIIESYASIKDFEKSKEFLAQYSDDYEYRKRAVVGLTQAGIDIDRSSVLIYSTEELKIRKYVQQQDDIDKHNNTEEESRIETLLKIIQENDSLQDACVLNMERKRCAELHKELKQTNTLLTSEKYKEYQTLNEKIQAFDQWNAFQDADATERACYLQGCAQQTSPLITAEDAIQMICEHKLEEGRITSSFLLGCVKGNNIDLMIAFLNLFEENDDLNSIYPATHVALELCEQAGIHIDTTRLTFPITRMHDEITIDQLNGGIINLEEAQSRLEEPLIITRYQHLPLSKHYNFQIFDAMISQTEISEIVDNFKYSARRYILSSLHISNKFNMAFASYLNKKEQENSTSTTTDPAVTWVKAWPKYNIPIKLVLYWKPDFIMWLYLCENISAGITHEKKSEKKQNLASTKTSIFSFVSKRLSFSTNVTNKDKNEKNGDLTNTKSGELTNIKSKITLSADCSLYVMEYLTGLPEKFLLLQIKKFIARQENSNELNPAQRKLLGRLNFYPQLSDDIPPRKQDKSLKFTISHSF